ncbi:glycosyltransferase family 25 protein [Tepidimonas charontis]|uniref:Glycosyltransferase family 25 (LPS biosynthesis protein) n=1 Tax=Tepidimonas charontis TaxID=2267262 RepID=A0A554XK91_9BURK|nr:glycosyltransferase family 25 protein [Tepidimonas charontis]TSE36243.1 Glycosyltransferase family 25 (LPS biosynthesis protein) [Tepidimonas charontis]
MLPIVYINLDRDAQRRERMEAVLANLPLSYQRLPGVLWTDLDSVAQAQLYCPALNAQQFCRPLVDGEKGCYASHLRACEHLLASAASALVVLEDDVTLQEGFVDVVQAISTLPPDGWDIIKLYSRPSERAVGQRMLTARHHLIRYRRVPSMSNGYVLSRSGARKLLQHRRPFGRPVDVDVRYWWECDLRVLGVLPSLVIPGVAAEASSIWHSGRPRRTRGERWCRWWSQIDYSMRNLWHLWRQPRPEVLQAPSR